MFFFFFLMENWVVGIVIPFVIMAGSYILIFYKVSIYQSFNIFVSEC